MDASSSSTMSAQLPNNPAKSNESVLVVAVVLIVVVVVGELVVVLVGGLVVVLDNNRDSASINSRLSGSESTLDPEITFFRIR